MASLERKVGEKLPRWAYLDCDECGIEFLATRTEERLQQENETCSDCNLYDKAYNKGHKQGYLLGLKDALKAVTKKLAKVEEGE